MHLYCFSEQMGNSPYGVLSSAGQTRLADKEREEDAAHLLLSPETTTSRTS